MNTMGIFLFGLTVALAVGPMSLLIVQRCIAKGALSGVTTASAIAAADTTCALVAFIVGDRIVRFVGIHTRIFNLISAMILSALAAHIAYEAVSQYRSARPPAVPQTHGKDFISAYFLTIHNPLTIGFFLGLMPLVGNARTLVSVALSSMILGAGSLAGQLCTVAVAMCLRGLFQNQRTLLTINVLSAVGIFLFALSSLMRG